VRLTTPRVFRRWLRPSIVTRSVHLVDLLVRPAPKTSHKVLRSSTYSLLTSGASKAVGLPRTGHELLSGCVASSLSAKYSRPQLGRRCATRLRFSILGREQSSLLASRLRHRKSPHDAGFSMPEPRPRIELGTSRLPCVCSTD
jgi:hypothetical protein